MRSGQPGAIRSLGHDGADRPFLVIWELTRACQLACVHCRAEAIPEPDPTELSFEEGCSLLDDLAAYGAPRPMVVLTGGDPLERPDLVALIEHGSRAGLHVSVAPSATPHLTAGRLGEIRSAGARTVALSLDGADAATHDDFRQIDGVFDRTIAAASAVRRAGLRLQVNSTVTRTNVTELAALAETVIRLGASLWSVFFLVPTGRGHLLDMLDAEETEDVLHWLHEIAHVVPVKTTEAPHYRRIALQRRNVTQPDSSFPPGPLRQQLRAETRTRLGHLSIERRPRPPLAVNAGRGFAFVDHRGSVYPSGFLPLAAGSIREQPFPEIYRSSQLLTGLRDLSRLRGRCGRCEFRDACGGSRSRAFAVSGDPWAEDPSCAYEPGSLTPRFVAER